MKRKKKTVKLKRTIGSAGSSDNQSKTVFNKPRLRSFEKQLLDIKIVLRHGMGRLEDSSLKKSGRDGSGNLSNLPLHLADVGSDTFEQDFSLGLLEGGDIEAKEIDEALERITNKTFGICEECSKPIAENRLKVIPYARFCVKCQEASENNLIS
jgi:RNA polymerase-binding transcription factor DksA